MRTDHQKTQEEKAYWRLLDEARVRLSWPAHALFCLADNLAYAEYMVPNYIASEEDYDEADDKMRFVAAGLTDGDFELLTAIVRAAKAAASSVEPDDYETIAGVREHPANLRLWYGNTAAMLEETLREERARRVAMQDPSYIPF